MVKGFVNANFINSKAKRPFQNASKHKELDLVATSEPIACIENLKI